MTAKKSSSKNKCGRKKTGKIIPCKICGKEKYYSRSLIKRNSNNFCSRECFYKNGSNNKTHGMSRTREYETWCRMISRCENKKSLDYKDYGGRGIRVCKRWRESFKNFYNDMGKRPSHNYSIERLNNDNDYQPDNCIWANNTTQQNNKRNSLLIKHNGITKTLSQWSKTLNISYIKLYKLYKKNKLDIGKFV